MLEVKKGLRVMVCISKSHRYRAAPGERDPWQISSTYWWHCSPNLLWFLTQILNSMGDRLNPGEPLEVNGNEAWLEFPSITFWDQPLDRLEPPLFNSMATFNLDLALQEQTSGTIKRPQVARHQNKHHISLCVWISHFKMLKNRRSVLTAIQLNFT